MSRKREGAKQKTQTIQVWTVDQAIEAVPYLASILRSVREHRLVLWRRGMLTDALSQELEAELRRLIEELAKHQAAYHQESMYC